MAASHHDHGGGKPDGVAMAQKSKLYVGSLDGGVMPHAVVGGVCYCCKTAIAAGADGALYVAWRHVYPGNRRDIAFAVSPDRGRSFSDPVRVSEDKWMLEGCPDDGPSMAVDGQARVHIVWPTLVNADGSDPVIELFYATSIDGRSFNQRTKLPTQGIPHHPQIAVAVDGSLIAAWDEAVAGVRRAVVALAPSTEPSRFVRVSVSATETSVYPVIASSDGAPIAAWTTKTGERSAIAVRRIETSGTR
jgi:hypothetical protein